MAPLVQCYLFSGGALVFYVFLRGTMSPCSMFLLLSTFFYVVEKPIKQVPLHKWCPLTKGAFISQTPAGAAKGTSQGVILDGVLVFFGVEPAGRTCDRRP